MIRLEPVNLPQAEIGDESILWTNEPHIHDQYVLQNVV